MRLRVRFRLWKRRFSVDSPWERNPQGNRLKALLRGIPLSEYASEGFRVWLRTGKKKAYTALLQCRTFLCRKNGGHGEKISVVDMVFLVFIGFLYPPLAWKAFLWGQKKFPKRFSLVVVVYAFFFSVRRLSEYGSVAYLVEAQHGKHRPNSTREYSGTALKLFEQHLFVKWTGKKKAYTAPLQCRIILCRKKWGPQRKDFGRRYGFPGFHRVFVSTTGPESFSLRPEKFSKRFSFGGGSVRFLLLWMKVLSELLLLAGENWEDSGQEGMREYLFFSEFRSYSPR